MKETKEIYTLISQNLVKSKKTGKEANKAGKNKGKKPAARGSKAKDKAKGSRKKGGGSKAKAKTDSSGTRDKEDSNKEKDNYKPCCVSVELVWTVLWLPFLGVLIGK